MKKAPRSWLWLQGLICGALICLATPTAIVLIVLLAPGLTMWVVGDRASSRAMLLCGVAFSFGSLEELWWREQTIAAGLDVLQTPGVIAWAWAASCGGWLLREAAWMGAKLAAEWKEGRQVAALRGERTQLEHEWGKLAAIEPGPRAANRAP